MKQPTSSISRKMTQTMGGKYLIDKNSQILWEWRKVSFTFLWIYIWHIYCVFIGEVSLQLDLNRHWINTAVFFNFGTKSNVCKVSKENEQKLFWEKWRNRSRLLSGWCKSNCSFCIVAIYHLILEYILRYGYIIHHVKAQFSV